MESFKEGLSRVNMHSLKAGLRQVKHVEQSKYDEAHTDGGHVWSNDDLDQTPIERRTWGVWNFWTYWMSESWNASTWSVGSTMVSLPMFC
jgi:nucleobase:cation symporter-1, NCS1 family